MMSPLPNPPPQGERESRRHRLVAGASAAFATLVVVAGLTIVDAVTWIEASLPPLPEPAAIPTSTIVVDRDGKLLRPFTIADGLWRLPVTRAEVDARFLDMLIGYEDRRFADHHGVDAVALVRAAGQFILGGGNIVSGG